MGILEASFFTRRALECVKSVKEVIGSECGTKLACIKLNLTRSSLEVLKEN
jgi:hypothetical protein